MNLQLIKLSIKSLWRRRKQVLGTCILAFLVIMIITLTVIFRDNMYRMQDRINREDFGDWFVMQSVGTKENPLLKEHIYLGEAGVARATIDVYDEDYFVVIGRLGYFDEKFKEIGNVKLKEGDFPTKENEIAIEYNMLIKMGYDPIVGREIVINYVEGYGDQKKCLQKKYTLSGVLENISSIWASGNKIPSIIVTQKESEFYNNTRYNVYIYPLTEVITENHKEIFDGINEQSDVELYYNSYVFDYKPWGSEKVYNYIYIAVMVVGIAILSYKILDYQNTRKEFNVKMKKLGATGPQLNLIRIFENVFMLVIFGLLGILCATYVGELVAKKAEAYLGIEFYGVGDIVYIRGGIGIVAGIVAGEIANIIARITTRKNEKQRVYKPIKAKWYISVKNHIYQIHSRFVKQGGIVPALGVRIFYLCLLFVIISSSVNVYTARKATLENESVFDATGTKLKESYVGRYVFNYFFEMSIEEMEAASGHNFFKVLRSNRIEPLSYEEYAKLSTSEIQVHTADIRYDNCKVGANNLYTGFSNDFVLKMQELAGIEKIQLSCYENQRIWEWEGFSFEKMGYDTLSDINCVVGDLKYLFATEYINATEALYSKLKKYIEPEYYDYEAFKNGEQIIVFLDKNADGYYDDTIKPGMDMRYKYYNREDILRDTIEGFDRSKGVQYLNESTGGRSEVGYLYLYGTNVAPQIAGVVYLDDKVRNELGGIVTEFGYYTAIASMELAYKLSENDVKLYQAAVKEEYQKPDFGMKYSKIALNYNDNSVMYATENKVNSYLKGEGATYNNYTDQKNIYYTQLINALLQNGITIALCVIVSVSVSIILTHNRFNNRKKELQRFRQIGMEKNKLMNICMLEALRESLWCIVTAPLVLLAQFITYKIKFREL